MQIGLTIPLIRHLEMKNVAYGQEPADRFFCWDLHIITLKGRKSLLAVHCSSRFVFVVWDMMKPDWDSLDKTVAFGIRRSLKEAGIPVGWIEQYFTVAGKLELTKTHGRREVAFLNRAWDDVTALDVLITEEEQWQRAINDAVNDLPRRCAGREGLQASVLNLLADFHERKEILTSADC